jgi:hypothetical protein
MQPLSAAVPTEQTDQAKFNERLSVLYDSSAPPWWDGSGVEIVRATRSWIQYGTLAFAVLCIVIGAVEALFGR